MSLLLLDTTVLIDAERDPAAVDEVIADDDDTAIAAVTVAELQVGASLVTAADGRPPGVHRRRGGRGPGDLL